MNKITEAMIDYWGEKCADFDEDCPCCQAWKEYKDMLEKVCFFDVYIKNKGVW